MFDGFSHDNIVKIKLPSQTYVNMSSLTQYNFISIFGKAITSFLG